MEEIKEIKEEMVEETIKISEEEVIITIQIVIKIKILLSLILISILQDQRKEVVNEETKEPEVEDTIKEIHHHLQDEEDKEIVLPNFQEDQEIEEDNFEFDFN